MEEPITIVSGLPRSGTSMMMRALEAGGMTLLVDGERRADDDNPLGYYELEAVKRTTRDPGWLAGASGRVVKIISYLLRDLPAGHRYKVIFMRRHLDEILRSQRTMLARRGEPATADDQEMKRVLMGHVAEVEGWLRGRHDMEVLYVSYNRMLEDPRPQVARIDRFLGAVLDLDQMVAAVDPALYRQRHAGSGDALGTQGR